MEILNIKIYKNKERFFYAHMYHSHFS